MGVAARIGMPEGEALIRAARSSFVDAMGTTVVVAAGVAHLSAAVVVADLPSRKRELAGDAVLASARHGLSPLEPAAVVDK
jgi:hypothetical protein